MTDPLGLIPTQGISPTKGLSFERAQKPVEGPGFKQVLMQNLEEVNRLQQDAENAIADFNKPGSNKDLASVNMAMAKADIAFEMLLQVRNKLMDAYEEVKQIRV